MLLGTRIIILIETDEQKGAPTVESLREELETMSEAALDTWLFLWGVGSSSSRKNGLEWICTGSRDLR